MKYRLAIAMLVILPIAGAMAQQQSGKTLAATMDVFVFPAEGQDSATQSKHEVECYDWAVSNTGNDPFELQKLAAAQQKDTENQKAAAEKTGQGAGAGGAVRGAAVGALIGEIADDDASKGAAYGAAAGLISGRRQGYAARKQARAQAERQGREKQAATEEQIDNFKKAFSVCLEAKDYMVKY